jgi:hypothetical protein
MALIEKAGQVYINEQAREKLEALWLGAYESNMKKMIPIFAKQLAKGEIGYAQRFVRQRAIGN